MLNNNYRSLDELRFLAEKCPRCSQCKFPPLTRVEHGRFSGVCPSYEEFKFHAASGAGMIVMAISLLDGRSRPNENVRRFVYGCTLCGACDVSCKYSSAIEVLEILYWLRARCFQEVGPEPEHRRILENIEKKGHPLPEAKGGIGDWLRQSGLEPGGSDAPCLVWVGPHYALESGHRRTLLNSLSILRAGGVRYTLLGDDEPYAGAAALEIGDRGLFERCAKRAADVVNASSAKEVICLSAEDYSTLRAQVPRYAPIRKPVRHVTDIYDELLKRRRLRPARPVPTVAAWHDPCYLGRRSEPYRPWQGERKKVFGQLIVYDPPRPVNRGGDGCYEPPRRVLGAIPGLVVREFYRRREYAFNGGEGGQASAVAPEFVANTARRRVEEAREIGIETIITECPQSAANLESACAAMGAGAPRFTTLTDLLWNSL